MHVVFYIYKRLLIIQIFYVFIEFCLNVPLISKIVVLKFTTIIIELSSFSLISVNLCFMNLKTDIRHTCSHNSYLFLMKLPFIIMKHPSLSLTMHFVLKSTLLKSIFPLSLLCLKVTWCVIFHLLTFSLSVFYI